MRNIDTQTVRRKQYRTIVREALKDTPNAELEANISRYAVMIEKIVTEEPYLRHTPKIQKLQILKRANEDELERRIGLVKKAWKRAVSKVSFRLIEDKYCRGVEKSD